MGGISHHYSGFSCYKKFFGGYNMRRIFDSDEAPLIFIGIIIVVALGVIGYFWWHDRKVDNFLSKHSCTIISDKLNA